MLCRFTLKLHYSNLPHFWFIGLLFFWVESSLDYIIQFCHFILHHTNLSNKNKYAFITKIGSQGGSMQKKTPPCHWRLEREIILGVNNIFYLRLLVEWFTLQIEKKRDGELIYSTKVWLDKSRGKETKMSYSKNMIGWIIE